MKPLHRVWKSLYIPWNVIAGVSIVLMVGFTTADVVCRIFGRPIRGIYDLIGILACISYAAALPETTAREGHVSVQLFVRRLPARVRTAVTIITTCLSMALFAVIAWESRKVGIELREAGRVTPDLLFPFYYLLYLIALASFFVCLILARTLLESLRKIF